MKKSHKKRTSQSSVLLMLGWLALITIGMYGNTFLFHAIFDDKQFLSSIANQAIAFDVYGRRWLSTGSFAWTIQLFGDNIIWLRVGNVLLHASNVLLLFYFLKRIFQLVLLNASSSPSEHARLTWFAFFGALLFALHPVAVYSVVYLTQRSTLMATGFVLLMLITYVEGLIRQKWYWMIVAAMCYFAAVYSKEHSVAAPGLAIAVTLLLRSFSWSLLRQVSPFFLIAAAVAVSITLDMKTVLGEVYEPVAKLMLVQTEQMLQNGTYVPQNNLYLLSIISQSFLFFKYVFLWLLPNPAWLSVDMREPLALSFFSWPHALGVIGFVAYLISSGWLLCRRGALGLLGFAMLFPAVLFTTEFSTVRVQEAFVLYRSYLWMPGIFLALPIALGRFQPKFVFLGLTLLAVAFMPMTHNRIQSFVSNIALWQDAEILVRDKENVLGAERIYRNLGTALGRKGHYKEALVYFNQAIAINPNGAFDYFNRASAFLMTKKYHEAIKDYSHAITLDPNKDTFYYLRAQSYRALGNISAANHDLEESCTRGGKCR